jgi:hypothetical protein
MTDGFGVSSIAFAPRLRLGDRGRGTTKMRILGIVALGAALGGCAGSPVGDAIAGPEKLAQQDDAYCESIGAAKGTPQYTNCRLTVTQQRETKHNVVRGALLSQPDVVIINQHR